MNDIELTVNQELIGDFSDNNKVEGLIGDSGIVDGEMNYPTGGASDYDDLTGKPKINNITVQGSKTGSDYGLANNNEVYNKTETNSLLNEKADLEDTYTKNDIDTKLFTTNEKVETNKNNITVINQELNNKAEKANTYLKTETDNLLKAKTDKTEVLLKNNIEEYTPTKSTHPSTKGYVDEQIASINQFKVEVVTALPGTGKPNVLYLVEKVGSSGDVYDEYVWINNSYEHIGTTAVDLSNYYTKVETDSLVSSKVDKSEVYTKTQSNDLLNTKSDKTTTYTKTETNNLLNQKANQSTTFNKDEVNNLLVNKSDKQDTYTKTQVDTKLNDKANLSDVAVIDSNSPETFNKIWIGEESNLPTIRDGNTLYIIKTE